MAHPLDIIDDMTDEKNLVKEQLNLCSEGFDIEANHICKLKTIEALVDYLVDTKGQTMAEAGKEVDLVVNRIIEMSNSGSRSFISEARAILVKKFAPIDPHKKLLVSIVKDFNTIPVKYTTPDIRVAIESFNSTIIKDDKKSLALGEVYFEKFVTKYLKVCPKDFVDYITK